MPLSLPWMWFQMLGLQESLDLWRMFYFGGHVGLVMVYLVANVVPTKKVC